MVRVYARYRKGQLVLERPLELPENAEVVIDVYTIDDGEFGRDEFAHDDIDLDKSELGEFRDELESVQDEQLAWERACSRLEEELIDSNSDDWRKVYAVGFTHPNS